MVEFTASVYIFQFLSADQICIAHHTMHRCSDQNVGSPWPDDHGQWQDISFRNRDCIMHTEPYPWLLSNLAGPPPMLQATCFKKNNNNLEALLLHPRVFFTVFLNCSRRWLVIRHWPFAWWMQRCTQTWVCSCLWRQLLIVGYSFIKWFVSLLTHSEERAIWTSWVSNLRRKSLIFSSTECVAGK